MADQPHVITQIHRLAPGQIKVDCSNLSQDLAVAFWPVGNKPLPEEPERRYFTLDFSDYPFEDCVGYEQGLLEQIVAKCKELGIAHYHAIEYPTLESLQELMTEDHPAAVPVAASVAPVEDSRDTITDRIISDLKRRQQMGISKYGKPVYAGESYKINWLLMRLEEDLDGLVYLMAFLEETYPEELAAWRAQTFL